jgi:hypothetical protein
VKIFRMTALICVVITSAVLGTVAQVSTQGGATVGGAPGLQPHNGAMISMRIEDMDATPVKGVPFCATIATEHTQAFADGNRIHTTDNSTLCRDSEGRTRREAGLSLLGAASQAPAVKLITIVDPVAGVRYMLDTSNKTARKMPLSGPTSVRITNGEAGKHQPGGKPGRVMIYQDTNTVAGSEVVFDNRVVVKKSGDSPDESAPASENLGDQSINGIHATGTRITTTIPSGKMGNEQPIMVTSERWYSPELKATVMTKHSDPWAGELKTQFTNVSTAEPDSSLFTVPADYKVLDDKDGPFTIQLPPPVPPGQ